MPTNLYGPNDNYDLQTSHVLAALLRKAHEAKLLEKWNFVAWGSGRPLREFMHVHDIADACVFLMERPDIGGGVYNVSPGTDVTIRGLAETIMEVVGSIGDIVCDSSKPDGTPRKPLDGSSLATLGWRARIELKMGLASAYADFSRVCGAANGNRYIVS